jgi:hypothetical protein
MYKINVNKLDHHYSEISQSNSLRYMMLKRDSEHTFNNTTNEFKCRDFFNDFAYSLNTGEEFTKYGMFSTAAKLDVEDRVWMLLKYTAFGLKHNINAVLLPKLKETWADIDINIHPNIIVNQRKPTCTLLISLNKACFASTFRISVITQVLRNCNRDTCFENWEQCYNISLPGGALEHWCSILCERGTSPELLTRFYTGQFKLKKEPLYKLNHIYQRHSPGTIEFIQGVHDTGWIGWFSNSEVV